MQCPICKYTLTEGERILCSVGGNHYCPRCWSQIPEPERTAPIGYIDPVKNQGTDPSRERE